MSIPMPLDFQELSLPRLELQDLGRPFSEAEVWELLKIYPSIKPLAPMGLLVAFTGRASRLSAYLDELGLHDPLYS